MAAATTRGDTVGIVGAGTFGSALGAVLAKAGRRVVIWSRDVAVVESIEKQRVSPRMPSATLGPSLIATADPRVLAAEARFLVLAVGSANARERARELGDVLDGSHIVVHAIGALAPPALEPHRSSGAAPTNQRVSEVMLDGLPTLKVGVLAGPALPADLALGEFSSMVAASVFDEVVAESRRLLNIPPSLRVYGSKDLIGVELASALAGAYTVALGICDGLAVGPGPRAVLVTRAVAEASRLGKAAGAEERTFAGLAGLGNLLVRSTGDRSADYVLGKRLAGGATDAEDRVGSWTEGARAAHAGCALAATLKVRMPVLQGVAAVLAGKRDPKDVAKLIAEEVAALE